MTKRRTPSKPLIFAFFAIVAILMFSLIFLLFSQKKNIVNNVSKQQQKTGATCLSGRSQKKEFLKTYKVLRGDSLLSISRDQLKDVSRVNELIELNKDNYPKLSVGNSFIEQGWGLYLPPDFTTKTSGMLAELKGEIRAVRPNDGAWEVGDPAASSHFAALYVDKDTKIFADATPKVGDCIKAVVDEKTGVVYSVSLQ